MKTGIVAVDPGSQNMGFATFIIDDKGDIDLTDYKQINLGPRGDLPKGVRYMQIYRSCLGYYRKQFNQLHPDLDNQFAAMEDSVFFMGSKGGGKGRDTTLESRAPVHMAWAFYSNGVADMNLITAGTWKKALGLKGNAKKNEVYGPTVNFFDLKIKGSKVKNQDMVDAVGIGYGVAVDLRRLLYGR